MRLTVLDSQNFSLTSYLDTVRVSQFWRQGHYEIDVCALQQFETRVKEDTRGADIFCGRLNQSFSSQDLQRDRHLDVKSR